MTFSGEFVRRSTIALVSVLAALGLFIALGSVRASAAPRSDSTEAVPPPCATASAVAGASTADAVGDAASGASAVPGAAAVSAWPCSVSSTTPSATVAATSSNDAGVDALALTDDSDGGLASTGVAVLSILGVAAVLLAAGFGFMFSGRRRANHT